MKSLACLLLAVSCTRIARVPDHELLYSLMQPQHQVLSSAKANVYQKEVSFTYQGKEQVAIMSMYDLPPLNRPGTAGKEDSLKIMVPGTRPLHLLDWGADGFDAKDAQFAKRHGTSSSAALYNTITELAK
jgi:hypothetical protein